MTSLLKPWGAGVWLRSHGSTINPSGWHAFGDKQITPKEKKLKWEAEGGMYKICRFPSGTGWTHRPSVGQDTLQLQSRILSTRLFSVCRQSAYYYRYFLSSNLIKWKICFITVTFLWLDKKLHWSKKWVFLWLILYPLCTFCHHLDTVLMGSLSNRPFSVLA